VATKYNYDDDDIISNNDQVKIKDRNKSQRVDTTNLKLDNTELYRPADVMT